MAQRQVADGLAVGVEAARDIGNVEPAGQRHIDVAAEFETQTGLVGKAQIVAQVLHVGQAVDATAVRCAKVGGCVVGGRGGQAVQRAPVKPVAVLRAVQAAYRHQASDGHTAARAGGRETGKGNRIDVVVRIGDLGTGRQVAQQTTKVETARHRTGGKRVADTGCAVGPTDQAAHVVTACDAAAGVGKHTAIGKRGQVAAAHNNASQFADQATHKVIGARDRLGGIRALDLRTACSPANQAAYIAAIAGDRAGGVARVRHYHIVIQITDQAPGVSGCAAHHPARLGVGY